MASFDLRAFRRLHNQIVLPLVVASIVVAALATVVAVDVVGGPVERHARGETIAAARQVGFHFQDTAVNLRSLARLVAEDAGLSVELGRGDLDAVTRRLVSERSKIGVSGIALVSPAGKVLMGLGDPFSAGVTVDQQRVFRYGATEMNASDSIDVSGRTFMTAVAPVRGDRGILGVIVLDQTVDRTYMAGVMKAAQSELVYFDANGKPMASGLGKDHLCLLPLIRPSHGSLAKLIASNSSNVRKVTCPMGTFYVSYVNPFESGSGTGVVAVVRSAAQVIESERSTALLIGLWGIVAVLFLMVLGTMIARTVSRPISDLAESARRVAEGDLSPQIPLAGSSDEMNDLAQSFNHMTEGLRDQTSVLTKRLLELTTLYEMGKTVGTTLDSQALLETVLDSALKVLGADVGYVMLHNPTTDKLELRAWRAPADVLVEEEALSNSIADWVLREGKPLVFGQKHGARQPLDLGSVRTRSALCVPMRAKSRIKGVLTIAVLETDSDLSNDNVNLLMTIANQAAIALENAELFDSLQQAYLATVRALAAAVDAKDPYTHGHSEEVAHWAMLLGEELDLPEEDLAPLETAAYLHDIGKIGVKDEILLKPGALDPDELTSIKHHPLIGSNILAPVPFPWPVIPIVRHHHEHWDGSGYPAGLVGEEIPYLARVLSVADAYEAMTSHRPYRKANTAKEAAAELRRCAGTQFDPNMVEPFLTAIARDETEREEVVMLPVAGDSVDEAEVEAVFVAVADSLLSSLRRLGGPRVATNFQQQMNTHFAERGLDARFDNGHLITYFGEAMSVGQKASVFRDILASELYSVERNAGSGIAEHFYTDAINSLPSRHKGLARQFGFDRVSENPAS